MTSFKGVYPDKRNLKLKNDKGKKNLTYDVVIKDNNRKRDCVIKGKLYVGQNKKYMKIGLVFDHFM